MKGIKGKFKLVNDEFGLIVEFVENTKKTFRVVKQDDCNKDKIILETYEDIVRSLMNFLNENLPYSNWRLVHIGVDDYTDIFDIGGKT